MALVRLVFKHVVPAALIGSLYGLQQTPFPLLPVNPAILTRWWGLALLTGVIGALVASSHFREGREFGVAEFLTVLLMALALASPFIVGPYGYTFGLPGALFSIVSTAAYVLFHGILGVLVGGAWTVLVIAFGRTQAKQASRESAE